MNRNNCLFPILYIFIHIETHSRQLEEDAAAAAGHSGDAVQDLGGGSAVHPGLQVDDDDDDDDDDEDDDYDDDDDDDDDDKQCVSSEIINIRGLSPGH